MNKIHLTVEALSRRTYMQTDIRHSKSQFVTFSDAENIISIKISIKISISVPSHDHSVSETYYVYEKHKTINCTSGITSGFVDRFRSAPGRLEDEDDSMTCVTSTGSLCCTLFHRFRTCKLSTSEVVIYHKTAIFGSADKSAHKFRENLLYSLFI
jgi:hypothetical protein